MAERESGSDDANAPDVESVDVFDRLRTNSGTLLVDFYADWCGPCQLMADTIEDLAVETDATVVKVDVETLPEVAMRYDVRGIPAFVVFESGTPTDRLVGMQDKAALGRLLE